MLVLYLIIFLIMCIVHDHDKQNFRKDNKDLFEFEFETEERSLQNGRMCKEK